MEAQDRLLELILTKQDEIHDDLKSLSKSLTDHIEEDRRLAGEVFFMKRAVQTTWGVAVAAVGIGLAWLGVRNS